MIDIDHVTVIVAAADATASLWGALTGADVLEIVDSPGLVVRTLRLPNAEIHFVEFPGHDAGADGTASPPLGLHHVALRVPDLAQALDRFRGFGITALGEPVETAPGVLEVFVDVAAAGDVPLQLVERRSSGPDRPFDAGAVAALAAQGRPLPAPARNGEPVC